MENTEKSLLGIRDRGLGTGFIRTFGRIHGKKLSTRQAWLIENILPTLIPSPQSPVPQNRFAILEIGFGAGEHLLHLAETNPEALVIGAEPYINGVASLLSQMTDEKNEIKPEYKNIKIWPDDIRKLLSTYASRLTLNGMQNINFEKIYILHPDPWPKARHEKRRLLSAEFLNELSAYLAPDGKIIIGTDHYDYFKWILEQLNKTGLKITNFKESSGYDYITPPESGLDTRYKEKNMFESAHPMYLTLYSRLD